MKKLLAVSCAVVMMAVALCSCSSVYKLLENYEQYDRGSSGAVQWPMATPSGDALSTKTTATTTTTTTTTTTAAPTTTTTTVASAVVPDVFPHSSTAYLTEQEIADRLMSFDGESPTGNYAQDGINEIYARHGYEFQNQTIRAFYAAKGWYTPDSSFSYGSLNACEQANIALLKTYK